ncbi:hypothetical protein ACGF12_21985 [Kitasatospora sp. NPDC048296]|uniref:hypothetical protein n=1 Tax=Kitasatospora sp. NPDC048296 TaxID=3364048 RepID=UPI00371C8D9B
MSAFVVLTGDSSTGKTRALFEALRRLAPARPLWRPTNAAGLAELLGADRIAPGAVLWLNEAQRFLYGDRSEEAAAALRELLMTQTGVTVVGTLWTLPYWEDLTRPAVETDPRSQVRALLEAPVTHRVSVPADLTTAERLRWESLADSSKDPRMGRAVRAGAADGRVIQHLSGGPQLLAAYRMGPGAHFTHAEHALITAAITARQLGHYAPLSEELLTQAADAALPPHHRPAEPGWGRDALIALTSGVRADGCRTDIRHSLTALIAVRNISGGTTTYEPADYLHQSLVAAEDAPAPTPALWDALTMCTTDLASLVSLSSEAQRRGFLKQTVLLMRRAAIAGYVNWFGMLLAIPQTGNSGRSMALWMADHVGFDSLFTARLRLWELHRVGPDVSARLAARVVSRVNLADADEVQELFEILGGIGHEKLLVNLDPGAHVRLPDETGAFRLLDQLLDAGYTDHAVRLADRILSLGPPVRNPQAMGTLLKVLNVCGHDPEVAEALSWEAARQVDLSTPYPLVDLVEGLWDQGREEAACLLADRIVEAVDPSDTYSVAQLLYELRCLGVISARRRLAERAVPMAVLEDPEAVGWLLEELRNCGLDDCLDAFLARDPSAEVVIGSVQKVVMLLRTLKNLDRDDLTRCLVLKSLLNIGLDDAEYTALFFDVLAPFVSPPELTRFALRAVEEVPLSSIAELGFLARSLEEHHQSEALDRLACRAIAAVDPDASTFLDLLRMLRARSLDEHIHAMIERVAAHPGLAEAVTCTKLLSNLRTAGETEAADRLGAAASRMTPDSAAITEKPRVEPGGQRLYGLETDGTPACPWTWESLDRLDQRPDASLRRFPDRVVP